MRGNLKLDPQINPEGPEQQRADIEGQGDREGCVHYGLFESGKKQHVLLDEQEETKILKGARKRLEVFP